MARGSTAGDHPRRLSARLRRGRGAVAVVFACAAACLLVHAVPDRSGLSSRAETKRVLERLGVRWTHSSPPVVIITVSSDRTIGIFLASFENQQRPCVQVNVDETPEARAVLAEISKDRWGRRIEPVLPTLIIGTRVLQDPTDWPSIEKAYQRESDWVTIL